MVFLCWSEIFRIDFSGASKIILLTQLMCSSTDLFGTMAADKFLTDDELMEKTEFFHESTSIMKFPS